MPETGRLILFATVHAANRLRDGSGCRAFGDGTIRHVDLDALLSSRGPDEAAEEAFRTLSARDRPPACLLWVAEHPGDTAALVESLRRLLSRFGQELQPDRNPLPWSAVIVVCARGLNGADRAALRRLADHQPNLASRDPLDQLLPCRLPVYLLLGATRVLADGRGWPTSTVWPVAAGRLLGSIATQPQRTPGLRAFRALAFDSIDDGVDSVDNEAARLLNEALAGDPESEGLAPGERRAHREPHVPPSDRVDDDHCPAHSLDRDGMVDATRPEVPEFSDLTPCDDAIESATPDTPVPGGATIHTEERLSTAPGFEWNDRQRERGLRFLADRLARFLTVDRSFVGPRGLVAQVWSHLHESAGNLRWYASGGFFRSPARSEFERLSVQMRRWRAIRAADRQARYAVRSAAVEAAELDLARSHYVSTGWRVTSALAAAAFATAALSVPARAWGGGFTVIVAIASGLSAALAMLVLVYLELRAGRRGRTSLETANRRAEHAIASAFRARVVLGADGELLQRSTAWLQGAARIRDAARRLLDLRELALNRMSGRMTIEGASHATGVSEFRRATTADIDLGLTPAAASDRISRRDPSFILSRRERLQNRWQSLLRDLDPTEVGGISAADFLRRMSADLEEVRDSFRRLLMEEIEQASIDVWREGSRASVARMFGPGTDLPGLSASTLPARGNELMRVTQVFAPTERMASLIADGVREASHGSCRPVAIATRMDVWGSFSLVIDEIGIRFSEEIPGDDTLHHRVLEGIQNSRSPA